MNDIPEPDRLPEAPHPRETVALFGQEAAEAAFLEAFSTGRLHHGWLITGPRGVGKATLAWRMARFLLANPPAAAEGGLFGEADPAPKDLDIGPDHPVARRIAARSEPGLFHLKRGINDKTGRLRNEIVVDEVRRLKEFFALSSTDGGRRVVIVDSADELNTSAANALLKLLEEPPANATLLLVSHQPSGLLPTIRSRCRVLRCAPLAPPVLAQAMDQAGIVPSGPKGASDEEVARGLAQLAGGSVGDAIGLISLDGLKTYGELVALMGGLPRLDRGRALKLAERAAARGAEDHLALLIRLIDLFLTRLARSGATGAPPPEAVPGEAALLMRLCPSARAARGWAELSQELSARASHARAVNLDPAALILDMVFRIDRRAADLVAPAGAGAP